MSSLSETRLYDTLSTKLTPLVPREPGHVRVYCCGPTTYDVAHVGHARAAIAPDVLVRHLRSKGLKVTYVRNITDVDDKILKRAAESGEEPMALSARMAQLYQEDVTAFGCAAPDVEPKVSEHIPEIVAIIERLIELGAAYEVVMPSGLRDVYYAVRSFDGYGKLSKRNVDEMRVGARIEANETKHDPLDFALWKGCSPEAWGWESPFGRGRPGWHIECSAMSSKYLGHGFDVHTGGMDLIFPHHENEIAQSEAAHPGEGAFVHLWMHNGFVNIDKEKMAKSLGNFVTIRDVYDRNDPEALRYFLLTVHYRGPIVFDTEKMESGRVVFPGIVEAERRIDYLYATRARLASLAGEVAAEASLTLPANAPRELGSANAIADAAAARVTAALDEDLNTPVALAVIAEAAKAANELFEVALKKKKDARFTEQAARIAARLGAALDATFQQLGLCQAPPEIYEARTRERRLRVLGLRESDVEAQLAERAAARAAKDFERGDALRKALEDQGVELFDAPTGTTFRLRL